LIFTPVPQPAARKAWRTTGQADGVQVVIAASKTWRLKGTNQLPKVIEAVRFSDGIEVILLQQAILVKW
jgi:hypothetical protein